MIRPEDRLQKKRKHFDNWFVRANCPVVSHVDERPVRRERPDTSAFQIASRFHREAVRVSRFHGARFYCQRVRQPASGAKHDYFADSVVPFARFEFFHFEIHRAPPARKAERVFDYLGDFLDVGFDAPLVYEVIIVGGHSALPAFHSGGESVSPQFAKWYRPRARINVASTRWKKMGMDPTVQRRSG